MLDLMDIAAALREIDAVIERLEDARAILTGVVKLPSTNRRPGMKLQLGQPAVETPASAPLQEMTFVQPKLKRQYGRRAPTPRRSSAPQVLSSTIPVAPVFVPRAEISVESHRPAALLAAPAVQTMEVVMRRNLLGVVA